MSTATIDRVRLRRKELTDEIIRLQEERNRLDAFLQVHEEFSRPSPRKVSGKEIDALCQLLLRNSSEPMTPSQLVKELENQFGAVVDAVSPARLVSTRMSSLASVESKEGGWQLVSAGIELEPAALK